MMVLPTKDTSFFSLYNPIAENKYTKYLAKEFDLRVIGAVLE